jgi:hypothetical protein
MVVLAEAPPTTTERASIVDATRDLVRPALPRIAFCRSRTNSNGNVRAANVCYVDFKHTVPVVLKDQGVSTRGFRSD